MAQHAILRFEKHKGNPARPLEAHHERQKEQYASNPDIDTSRSKYNFHIVKPEGRYYHFIQSRIEQGWCMYACCLNCGTETAHVSYKTPEERLEAARQAAYLWNIGKVIHNGMCD